MDQNDISGGPKPPPGSESDIITPTLYVGIGASAGGLEAIETFFGNMPPASGLAFIVVQHLSPDYKSLMVELLSRRTQMPVFRVEDGMAVQKDTVYLIPPKKSLTIFHGKLLLTDQDYSRRINLPIDIFLRSLAEDQGERAVGIILSGTGSDGMRGTRSIKENGGMIMVQDEETALFDGMPRSAISTGLADFILPPEEMPQQLLAFSRHPYSTQTDKSETLATDEEALTRIFALLREKSKVDFTYYKPSTVTRRIQRRISVNQLEDIRAYVEYLQGYPGEALALHRELLIGVTRFFRDQGVFDELGEKWLPNLLRKEEKREIRFWVAGCSTGEEAYTFAIMVRECMERLGLSLDVKIFATDVDKDAVLKAGSGIFAASIAADMSPRLLSKYFYHRDESFQIARNVREMVVFAQHNLIKDPPFTNIDLISCRNLLIYLQPVLQKKVLEMANFSLNPSGLLVLGTSETVGDLNHYFEMVSQKHKIFKSTGQLKTGLDERDLFIPPDRERGRVVPQYAGSRLGYRLPGAENTLERLLDSITGDYVPLTLIVNEKMEIQHVFGNTEGFLKVPSGKISNDLSKMAAKDLSIPLTTGIQKVFRTNGEMRFSNIHLQYMEAFKRINLRIKPLPQKKGQDPLAAVFLSEVQVESQEGDDPPEEYDLNEASVQRIKDLEQELQFTKENLQATIEELETANEELQATNEELLASNEELQSTNEELQSTNEELHTVNSEYQNKIIELTELNNDVENLLASTQIGTLLLDENLEIRKFSHLVTGILKILEKDAGRPITHISHYITNIEPIRLIRRVQDTSIPLEEQVLVESGRWYLMRVMPYTIGPDQFSGIVVTFVEITQMKKAQEALCDREIMLKQTAQLADVGSWEVDLATHRQKWSEETFRIHELDPGRAPAPEDGIAFYSPQSRPIIREAFQKACEEGEPYDLMLELITAKDNHRWVRSIGRAQFENGRVVKVSGAIQDITELKKIGETLQQTQARYQELFASMNEGFALHEIITDENEQPIDYRFLAVNPAFEKLTGLGAEELIGRRVLEVLPQTEDYWIQRYGRVALTGTPDYFEDYASEFDKWYSVTAHSPRQNQFCVTFTDITERKAMEAELRRSEELFRNLFQTMAQGVVYQNAGGEIIQANPAAEKILGLSLEQLQGRKSIDARWRSIHEDGTDFPGDEHPAMVALKTAQSVENVVMGVFNPVENETKWININAVPQFKAGENEPYLVYTTFEDFTDRLKVDRERVITKECLDLAFKTAGLSWWEWILSEDRFFLDPGASQTLGLDFDPAVGTFEDWMTHIHVDDRKTVRRAIKAHLDGETRNHELTYRLIHQDKQWNRIHERGVIVEKNEQDEPLRLIGVLESLEGRENGNQKKNE